MCRLTRAPQVRIGQAPPQPRELQLANFPVATTARIAGDVKQTRFILDLDQTSLGVRATTFADPYRVVVDIPQVNRFN